MLSQLLLGGLITLVSLICGSLIWWALSEALERHEPWLAKQPVPPKSLLVILISVLAAMLIMTLGVWIWALLFKAMAIFATLEEAVYYALVAYTTLGLGDLTIPKEYRLLAGMIGANGFLMFGLMTALLTDALRHVRQAHRRKRT